MQTVKNTWRNKPSVIFLVILFVLLLCLLLASLLIRSGLFGNGGEELAGQTPTQTAAEPALTATETTVAEKITPTPTPTRVVQEGTPTQTPTESAAATATPMSGVATATPRPDVATATSSPPPATGPTHTPTAEKVGMRMVNVLQNGGFEAGVGKDGVGLRWKSFTNGGAKYIFALEAWPLAIHKGEVAQRITIYEAQQSDRYAGIYQRVNVIPDQPYKLTLYGQIRSKAGDIQASQYGYRMQYAIDWHGGGDWKVIPAEAWIELPWDEQLLDGAGVKFLEYRAIITPPHDRLTLFIRAWSKWADPVEAQYTLDTLSLVGPAPGEMMIDRPLPMTGVGAEPMAFMTEPRFWVSLFFLALLLGAALWRHKYRRLTR